MPTRNEALAAWLGNFQQLLNLAPVSYGISVEQAAEMQALAEAFSAALAVLDNEETKSPLNVARKNQAKKEAVRLARQLTGIIQKFPGTDDLKRQALRINVPKPRKKGSRPTLRPVLKWLKSIDRDVYVEALESTDTTRHLLPDGVTGVHWYTWVGEQPPQDARQWFSHGTSEKTRAVLNIAGTDAATVWITAAFFNAHGEGPGQFPFLQVNLAAEGVVPVQPALRKAA